jgi:hypothetical protein
MKGNDKLIKELTPMTNKTNKIKSNDCPKVGASTCGG